MQKHNNLGRKRSTQIIQEKEVENSNSSVSEEETHNNNNNLPMIIQDVCTKGVLEDVTKHPLLNFFKVLVDNKIALHRIHFELSQVLKNKENAIKHANHIKNSKTMCMMLPKGESSRTNKKRAQPIKKIMDINENFAHKVLLMIENASKDAFFNCSFCK